MDTKILTGMLKERLIKGGIIKSDINEGWFSELVQLLHKRIKTLEDFSEQTKIFFQDKIEHEQPAVEEFLKNKSYLEEGFKKLIQALKGLSYFDVKNIEELLRAIAKEIGVSAKDFILPVRVAVTGKSVSPPLFESIYLFGKEKTIKNLEFALNNLLK
ncbi:MAG: hypothetical protein NTZ48_06150 [Candidatus Omnitrophica bacterium]|nr:hypothetical protein [Candidatus Omnitrophota bacterium]